MCSQSSESSLVRQGPGSRPEPGFLDQYEVLRAIGYGMFDQAHLARHRLTRAEVLVKVLKMVVQNMPVLFEPDILNRLEHPNVIRLFQVLRSEEDLYLVMEYPAGEHLLQRVPRGGMQQEEALGVFRQVVCGVGYCHDQGVVHLDLKPENIVVGSSGQVKIINFGYGARFRAGQKLNDFWGLLENLAPEIVLRQPYEGPPVDIWCLGVVLYFMLTGRRPFWGSTTQEMLWGVVLARYHVPSSVPSKARRLVHRILIVNPKKRPTPKQILRDPWLRQGELCAPRPSSEALPTRPESEVLTTLFKMGFGPYETWMSLSRRKFDMVMATYLLLKYPQGQEVGGAFQGRPVPHPRPEDHSHFPVLPRRSASQPALRTCPVPSEYPLPVEAQQPGHRAIRGGTLPAIPLCCPPAGAPALCTSSQGTAPGPGHTNVWKRVRRRIAAGVRALFRCMPRVSKVAPTQERRNEPRP